MINFNLDDDNVSCKDICAKIEKEVQRWKKDNNKNNLKNTVLTIRIKEIVESIVTKDSIKDTYLE